MASSVLLRWRRSRFAQAATAAILLVGVLLILLPPSTDTTPVIVFIPGQRLVYQIEFLGTSDYDFAAAFGQGSSDQSHSFTADLTGELIVTVLQVGSERTEVVYRLRSTDVGFSADGQAAPTQAQILQTELARPAFVTLDARGRMLSVRFDPATGALTQHMTRMLLAAMQFVSRPSGADAMSDWEVTEDDLAGTLLARYQVQADGTVAKSKTRRQAVKQLKKRRGIVLTPMIESEGAYVATLDSGCLAALSVAESQLVTVQGRRIGAGELKLEMRLLGKETVTPGELSALGTAETGPRVPLYVVGSPEEGRLAIQRKHLGEATAQSLSDELTKVTPEQTDLTKLFLKLKALAILHPDSCVRVGEWLATAEARSQKMRILTDALESAGHAEAQAALGAAIHARPDDWPALALLIPALGTAEHPTPETEQTLQTLAFGRHDKNICAAAQLALGNLALSMGDASPARAARIVQRLVLELAATPDSSWQLLLALGNAGSAEALPTLTRHLDDRNPELRGAATWALRWIDVPQADLLLIKVLLGDMEPAVRIEAVRTMRFRKPTGANFEAQVKALATDSEVAVRLALLGTLWDTRDHDSRAIAVIEQAAGHDLSPEVRAAAVRLLANRPPED